jgi:hypothetical protein
MMLLGVSSPCPWPVTLPELGVASHSALGADSRPCPSPEFYASVRAPKVYPRQLDCPLCCRGLSFVMEAGNPLGERP